MDKQAVLSEYKKQEDKICLSQVLDKIELAKKQEKIASTNFLDMYQISLVENFLRKINYKNYKLYGGYEYAERKILIVYPEKYTDEMIEKNYSKLLKVVRIRLKEEDYGKFSHRNYLGGIVKLGLKREMVGDILVEKEGADIVTVSDFANILQKELPSLTRFQNGKITEEELKDLKIKIPEKEEIKIIVPSLRLDNIVSDLVRTSRSKAAGIIEQERVFVNGQKARIIGRICMDQLIIDISNVEKVEIGDIVELIGEEEEISAESVAEKSETITNELLSRLGARIKRC